MQLTTATSCRMSAASAMLPSSSRMAASLRVSRARSISTKICTIACTQSGACAFNGLTSERLVPHHHAEHCSGSIRAPLLVSDCMQTCETLTLPSVTVCKVLMSDIFVSLSGVLSR